MQINELTNTDLLLENHTINKIDCLLGLLYKYNFNEEFTANIKFGILTQMTYQRDEIKFVVKPNFEQGLIDISFSNDTSWTINFAIVNGKPKYIGYTNQKVTIEEPHDREYYTLTSESIRQLTIQVLINAWFHVNNITSDKYGYYYTYDLQNDVITDDDFIRYYYRFILANYWSAPTLDKQSSFEKTLEGDVTNNEFDIVSHYTWSIKAGHANVVEKFNDSDMVNTINIHHIYPSGNITCVLTDNRKTIQWRNAVLRAFFKTIDYCWLNPIELYWHEGHSAEYACLETINANLLLAANIFNVYGDWAITEDIQNHTNTVSIPAINLFSINCENGKYDVSFKNKNNNANNPFDSLSLSGNQIISYTESSIEQLNCSGPLKYVSEHVIKFICKELTLNNTKYGLYA